MKTSAVGESAIEKSHNLIFIIAIDWLRSAIAYAIVGNAAVVCHITFSNTKPVCSFNGVPGNGFMNIITIQHIDIRLIFLQICFITIQIRGALMVNFVAN